MKNIVLLFGAGASVPANCPTVASFTESLKKNLGASESVFRELGWVKTLWNFVDCLSRDGHDEETFRRFGHPARFVPTFEHLAFLVETLEEYVELGSAVNIPESSLVDTLGFRSLDEKLLDSYLAASFLSELREAEAIWQVLSIKPSLQFLEARGRLVRLLKEAIPESFDTRFLAPMRELFRQGGNQIAIATTNYDRVLDCFFEQEGIKACDGFTKAGVLSSWTGFGSAGNLPKYLKLHGSLDWQKIPDAWFSEPRDVYSTNQVYKVQGSDWKDLLKNDVLANVNRPGFSGDHFV